MTALLERRIRGDRYEWRCTECRRWYASLADHLRRWHGWTYSPDNLFTGQRSQ